MTLLRLFLLAVLAAPAAGAVPVRERAIPLPHPGQSWIRVTSPNFTVISSAGAARTREVAQTLETVAGGLRRVHPRFDARFADTTVFVFARRGDCQPIFDLLLNQKGVNAPGAFVVQPDGGAAIVIDAGRNAGRTIRHELMHNILATSGTRLPLWLEEGIAEYFSTTVVRGDSVIMGRPIIAHHRSLRARGVLPIEDVLAAQSHSPIATNVLFYAQSWALVEWMMRTNRRSFYDFVADVEKGDGVVTAFRRRYSMDIGSVARSFRTSMTRPSASSAIQIERSEVPISEESISTADALHQLARFLGQLEHTRDDAERFLQRALDLEPQHARSIAALGALRAAEKNFEQASALFERALALAPDDAAIQVRFAEALMQNPSQPNFRRARELAAASLATAPSALAEALIGISYLTEDDPAPGIPPLERAVAARPATVQFALNLYALYLRANREADAGRLFSSVFERARDPQTTVAARAIEAREKAVRRDVARVAERNRQVDLYNQAVAAFNRGDHEAVLEHCHRLLTFATDQDICDRAERLSASARLKRGM
ncbi:MAG TPA: tetratricopeptide repeat protein [Thermoanaerobaculia bacterium]|nr:tetratricopeptide repeat protein [Thermoanaerobaculia bacterium]